jgi:hypothetical protein
MIGSDEDVVWAEIWRVNLAYDDLTNNLPKEEVAAFEATLAFSGVADADAIEDTLRIRDEEFALRGTRKTRLPERVSHVMDFAGVLEYHVPDADWEDEEPDVEAFLEGHPVGEWHGRLRGGRNHFWVTPGQDLDRLLGTLPRGASRGETIREALGLATNEVRDEPTHFVRLDIPRGLLDEVVVRGPTSLDVSSPRSLFVPDCLTDGWGRALSATLIEGLREAVVKSVEFSREMTTTYLGSTTSGHTVIDLAQRRKFAQNRLERRRGER